MLTEAPTKEGYAPFKVAGVSKQCQTWYKIVGRPLFTGLGKSRRPLILIHGGPAACHEYLLPMIDLYTCYDIPVILYDQIGAGRSTRLPEQDGDREFWVASLFVQELSNLVAHLGLKDYDMLGQSWGGMLGAQWAAETAPSGLNKLVLSNSPASVPLMLKGQAELRKKLPQDVQDTLDRCEREGDFKSPEFEVAINEFYKRFLCRLEEWPDYLLDSLNHMENDSKVYQTMQVLCPTSKAGEANEFSRVGPAEFVVDGTLRNWDIIELSKKIRVQTLLINGELDEIQDISVQPFFKKIPAVKWITFDGCSHMCHMEKREKYMKLVSDFLQDE